MVAGSNSPAAFAARQARTTAAVYEVQPRALRVRAQTTKTFILNAARGQTRLARPSWIVVRQLGPDTAMVKLKGGFAKLTELGSHHHPSGWEESAYQAVALATKYGPFAKVKHPGLRAKPFWEKGLTASRVPGKAAYDRTIKQAIKRSR